jgi:hypothetical protein
MSRWFSWWIAAQYHRPSWHAQLLLLKYYHVIIKGKSLADLLPPDADDEAAEPEDNPRAELARLRHVVAQIVPPWKAHFAKLSRDIYEV